MSGRKTQRDDVQMLTDVECKRNAVRFKDNAEFKRWKFSFMSSPEERQIAGRKGARTKSAAGKAKAVTLPRVEFLKRD